MKARWLLLVLLGVGLSGPVLGRASVPRAHAAAVCADFANQAAAQRAHNTRDPDHDGIYCESLPCPCSKAKGGHKVKPKHRSCVLRKAIVVVTFRYSKYPNIIAHIKRSWRRGYPVVLRINRVGAAQRREKLLAGIPTKLGYDRDEAPAAALRKRVRADVAYVRSHENRSAGDSLENQIRPYCNGQKVRYRFR